MKNRALLHNRQNRLLLVENTETLSVSDTVSAMDLDFRKLCLR